MFNHKNEMKYGMTVGLAIRYIALSESLTDFNAIKIPEPKMPANPVPDPKKPTVSPGKLFKNPRIVDSPIER